MNNTGAMIADAFRHRKPFKFVTTGKGLSEALSQLRAMQESESQANEPTPVAAVAESQPSASCCRMRSMLLHGAVRRYLVLTA